MSLSFSKHQTENRRDWLEIRTCTSPSCDHGKLISRTSGSDIPTISVTSNVFRVRFYTDTSVNYPGFVLNIIDNRKANCELCGAGKYKIEAGNVQCIQCIADTYSTTTGAITSSVCLACPANSAAAAASGKLNDCSCNAGFSGASGGTCTQCVAGTYTAVSASLVCTNCLLNTYSTTPGGTSSSVCLACPANSGAAAASNNLMDCTCNAGWTGSDGEGPCVQCVAGKYKISTGDAACIDCVIGQYSTVVGATLNVCQSCPSNSDAATASDSAAACICNAGFSGVRGELCIQCPVAKYRAAP